MTAYALQSRILTARAISDSALQLISNYRSGIVHSVFKRCCNVVLPATELFTVAEAKFPRQPGVIQVLDIKFDEIAAGATVLCSEREIAFPEYAIRISCSGAEIYSCRCHSIKIPPDEILKTHLHAAWRVIMKYGTENGLGEIKCPLRDYNFTAAGNFSMLGKQALAALASLCGGIIAVDENMVNRGIRGLLGLGPGLTPSGDDILGGIIAALFLSDMRKACHILRKAVKKTLAGGGCTTTVSECALRHTVNGEIADTVYSAVAGILKHKEPQVVNAIKKLINYGSTSGTETAMGICLGLELARRLPGKN
ncbi:MAG: DUF2877 domain-containing protein [Victivallales bacterium]|nr:DUF2877 domain-containing protein [Victivallales bacterium]